MLLSLEIRTSKFQTKRKKNSATANSKALPVFRVYLLKTEPFKFVEIKSVKYTQLIACHEKICFCLFENDFNVFYWVMQHFLFVQVEISSVASAVDVAGGFFENFWGLSKRRFRDPYIILWWNTYKIFLNCIHQVSIIEDSQVNWWVLKRAQ